MQGLWSGAFWQQAQPLSVGFFRPEGSDHRPQIDCKLLFNHQNIFGIFRVEDQYVRCVHTGFQSDVWKDSCVEFFIQPKGCKGYFNFEFNCGGALLASFVTDPTRVGGILKQYSPLTPNDNQQIRRYASLPSAVEPEISTPIVWMLEFSLPFTVLKSMPDHREPSKAKSGVPIFISAAMRPPTPTGFPGRLFPRGIFTIRQASGCLSSAAESFCFFSHTLA